MAARDRHETNRVATPLELMFDLASVIAIAAAAAGLHHGLAAGHPWQGLLSFAMAFFAIWWAWMGYTWLASAFGNEGMLFRLMTMVAMTGSLIIAAGIPEIFEKGQFYLTLTGYVVMRLALVPLWLMAAAGHPDRGPTCRRYATGIVIAQVYWIVAVLGSGPDSPYALLLFGIGVLVEISVPVLAERQGTTGWHRHHITERYGLLNIIVLGECFLATVLAFRTGADHVSLADPLLHAAIAFLLITFALWWIYFGNGNILVGETGREGFIWGYGHAIVFAAGASLGAGFSALVEVSGGHGHTAPAEGIELAIAIPVAAYLAGVWLVRDRTVMSGAGRIVLPGGALAILAAGAFLPAPLAWIAALTVLTAVLRNRS
ncbi:low temperature requirement protein A [Zhengella mangrovi]|uniref:low temperature requirement protein A n=1 Tax=Zhengella mangrovi TaxID=1982044 RepID=UPI00197BF5C7|nr:low temperature requirement protein A [Zhengella mangrovi]